MEFDVFVSYADTDRARKDWVTAFNTSLRNHFEKLTDRPLNLFWAVELGIGETWPNRILNACRHSESLIAIVSSDYFSREWCCKEWLEFTVQHDSSSRI